MLGVTRPAGVTGHISFLAMKSSLDPKTPRIVYGWFLLLHRVSSSAAFFGYLLFLVRREQPSGTPLDRSIVIRLALGSLSFFSSFFASSSG